MARDLLFVLLLLLLLLLVLVLLLNQTKIYFSLFVFAVFTLGLCH